MSPPWTLWLIWSQELLIGVFGFWALFQLWTHIAVFGWFEQTRAGRAADAQITLDRRSPLREFGLHHWNYALNNFYWVLCLALVVPIASRWSQGPAGIDEGQIFVSLAMTVFVVSAMLGTIIVRQARLPVLLDELSTESLDEADLYLSQRLWPFDRNWSSKLGIFRAFVLLGYIAIIELPSFFSG